MKVYILRGAWYQREFDIFYVTIDKDEANRVWNETIEKQRRTGYNLRLEVWQGDALLGQRGSSVPILRYTPVSMNLLHNQESSDTIVESVRAIDLYCDWCRGRDVLAVKQGPYIHHMCKNKNCAHEWDKVR